MELVTLDFGLIFWTLHTGLALIALIHLIITKRIRINLKIAWALAIIFIPFIGSVLYFAKNLLVKTN